MYVHILPSDVIGKISAGEVIESPADCVKELVENSLDAESSRVEVEILQGGKKYICVKDNGTGIHREDMDKVTLRWATSKIRILSDLMNIQVFGFRGEALYAISNVSRMTIRSRFFQDKLGVEMGLEGGKITWKRDVGMQVGTCVEDYDLFYNLPVRLKFLKKEDTERNKISKLVRKYALSQPRVHFTLVSNSRKLLDLPPFDKRKDRVEATFGTKFDRIETSVDNVNIEVYTSVENVGGEVHVFVNSRYVQNRSLVEYVRKAVGYKKVCVLFLDLPPYMVDVNVHPKKSEVRIYKEGKIKELMGSLFKKRESYPSFLFQKTSPYTVHFDLLGVLDNTLILVRIGDYLYFFDQHLLSERLNFERTHNAEYSCRSSIKAGRELSEEQAQELIKAWMNFENREVCPHGRPLYYRLYIGDVYKSLGRR
ncbi:MAG: DNA mismatch repair endonuclease MutL [Aquificaceae bacterium]